MAISTLSEKDASSPRLSQLLAKGFDGVDLPADFPMPSAVPAELISAESELQRQREQSEALSKILLHCRTMTLEDADTLYVLQEHAGQPMLSFRCTQNDSLDLSYEETLLACDDTSMAGFVACSGETVAVEDVHALAGDSRFSFNSAFDKSNGYRSKSMLTLPIRDRQGRIRAVLQLINRKRGRHHLLRDQQAVEDYVLPFSARDQELVAQWAEGLSDKFSD